MLRTTTSNWLISEINSFIISLHSLINQLVNRTATYTRDEASRRTDAVNVKADAAGALWYQRALLQRVINTFNTVFLHRQQKTTAISIRYKRLKLQPITPHNKNSACTFSINALAWWHTLYRRSPRHSLNFILNYQCHLKWHHIISDWYSKFWHCSGKTKSKHTLFNRERTNKYKSHTDRMMCRLTDWRFSITIKYLISQTSQQIT